MTFADAMDTNDETVFRNTDHFAEQVTFRPAHGSSSRTVTVLVSDDRQEEDDEEWGEQDQERIWVDVRYDTNADKGGIADHELVSGLAVASLVRSSDPPDAPWSYQKQSRNVCPHSRELLFGRTRPTRYGPAY